MVGHTWADTTDATGKVVDSGATDAALTGMQRFVVYELRFEVANTGATEIQLDPTLEAGIGASPDVWTAVPAVDPAPGQPFYAASDDGRTFRVRTAPIDPSAFRSPAASTNGTQPSAGGASAGVTPAPTPGAQPVGGVASAGVNPAPTITLPPNSYTEIEFAVRATIGAAWQQTYAFRLQPTDDTVAPGTPLTVTMQARPAVRLTLPSSTTRDDPTGLATGFQLAAASAPSSGTLYPLSATVDLDSPHIALSLTSDGCAACHAAHTGIQQSLLSGVYRLDPLKSWTEAYDGADFALCISCHAESPFADVSGSPNAGTTFAGHGYHMGDIEDTGTGGLDITVAGDGEGNALCGECHYNLHGLPTSERGLVVFAPDVQPYNGQITYDPTTQSCTLTCHDKPHDGLTFATPTPTPGI